MGVMGRVGLGLVVLSLAVVAVPAVAEEVSLDPTFSGDGKAVLAEKPSVAGAVVAHEGMVYVGGWHKPNDKNRPYVARLDDNGDHDLSFSGDGLASVQKPDGRLQASALTVDGADRALLVTQSGQEIQVARFTASGDVDTTFSSDGRRTLPAPLSNLFTSNFTRPAIVTDSKGRILVAAMVDEVAGSKVRVWRLRASGALDASWSGDGVKTLNAAKNGLDWMDGLAVDQQDRVLLGSDVSTGPSPAKVYRFRVNGSADTSFSTNGVVAFRFGKKERTWPLAIGVDDSGHITVAATSFKSQTYGAARFKPNGTRDVSYGDHGILRLGCHACQPWAADVEGGRVAVQLNLFSRNDGDHATARISASGERISVEWYPLNPMMVPAVAIDGVRTLLAVVDDQRDRALVARLA